MSFELPITQMAKAPEKAKKPEKSQEELREALELKLKSLKSALQEGIRNYEEALKDDIFEDAPGEPSGNGETRKEAMQKELSAFFDRVENLKIKLDSKETLSQATPEIYTTYTRPDGKKETITLDFEVKLAGFISFYQKTNIDLPADFEDTIRELWDRNQADIEKAIEQNGFDDILIIPENIPLADLAEKMKMKMGMGYSESPDFIEGGSFAGAVNQNADKSRIILYHKKTLPEIQTENGLDVHLNITGGEALKLFQQKPDEHMTLTDFMIMERKIFEETGKHISDYTNNSAQWLNTKLRTRLVVSYWDTGDPGGDRLAVVAGVLEGRSDDLGVRPSRCFF